MLRVAGSAPAKATAALVLLAAVAVYFIFVRLHGPPGGTPFDTYGYFVPIKVYAAQSFLAGGQGLLWTPIQSCGQPFFANTATGLLYPPHWLFLVLEPNAAVHVLLVFHVLVGAIGMLVLLRELGLSWAAAMAGAFIYELGDPMAQLTIWSPMQNGCWAWAVWALYFCERVLRAPSRWSVLGLAAALTIEILPGWILITALTYQVIAFRVAWEIIMRRDRDALRAAGAVVAALILVPCLAAVQIIPAAEFAQESFRVGVEVNDFVRFGGMAPATMYAAMLGRQPPIPFFAALIPMIFLAPFATSPRRLALFWLLIGVLYAILALGPATPLYGLFIKLPPGAALIRYAHRLFWITGLSLAFLSAFAIDTLSRAPQGNARRWLSLLIILAVAAALSFLTPANLRAIEVEALALVAGAFALALWAPARPWAPWLITAATLINLAVVPVRYSGSLFSEVTGYTKYQRSFAAVRAQITPQDRILINPTNASLMNLTLLHKTASLERLKEAYDYDALLVKRIVDFYNTLYSGDAVQSVGDLFRPKSKQGYRPRLVDLAAIRFVVAAPNAKIRERGLDLTRMGEVDQGVELYRNDRALPRARYVPRIEIVGDPPALLDRLANGNDDLTRVAFVEAPMPSGFTGENATQERGNVDFLRDDPEHLTMVVDAPARGFVTVADQFYPGWTATVNGSATPIVRGNFAFRLIEVPAGTSIVEMRYRPTSVAIGLVISTTSVLFCAIVILRGRRRP